LCCIQHEIPLSVLTNHMHLSFSAFCKNASDIKNNVYYHLNRLLLTKTLNKHTSLLAATLPSNKLRWVVSLHASSESQTSTRAKVGCLLDSFVTLASWPRTCFEKDTFDNKIAGFENISQQKGGNGCQNQDHCTAKKTKKEQKKVEMNPKMALV